MKSHVLANPHTLRANYSSLATFSVWKRVRQRKKKHCSPNIQSFFALILKGHQDRWPVWPCIVLWNLLCALLCKFSRWNEPWFSRTGVVIEIIRKIRNLKIRKKNWKLKKKLINSRKKIENWKIIFFFKFRRK